MGGLIGFLLGYYVGLKEDPDRLEELQRALGDILASREVQALFAGAQQAGTALLARFGEATRQGGPADLARAWKTIVESEEFKAALSGGTALFEDMARRASEGALDRAGFERPTERS